MTKRTRRLRTDLLLAIAGTACFACARSGAAPHPAPERALTTEVTPLFSTGISCACLPRTGDSTRFEVVLVADSLGALDGNAVTLERYVRASPRPGVTNRVVSVEIRRAGQTRIVGTSCWFDAGIVVRGSQAVLNHANIALSAPASVLFRVVDDRGHALSDSVWSTLQGSSQRVDWVRR